MENIEWKKTSAKISLKQKRSLGLFKKKYSFLLTYAAEVIRPSTDEEQERKAMHLQARQKMERIFPILDDASAIPSSQLEDEVDDGTVISRTLIVQDVEVSQEIFEQYQHQKSLPLKYNALNPNQIKIY